ncbi:hypothetical protein P7C71_g2314, partial [Lecanoromycetidae sp. Uapishka_2]
MPLVSPSTGLTITNPLVLYRALLATKCIDPDPAQHRLALHLQKLYYRLKDYQPEVDFSHRLDQLNRIIKDPVGVSAKGEDGAAILQKNEARRLITLLDALYEARCKLLISAEAGPDDLFFPEVKEPLRDTNEPQSEGDSVYSETFAEIYQDQTSPFRPNISSYTASASPPSYHSSPLPSSSPRDSTARSMLADEDSDFGPIWGAGRSHGPSDGTPGAGNEIGRQTGPDFARTGSFTGEDERFAYKRARSRLWEMCGNRWWSREGEGWWRPIAQDVRRWEGSPNGSTTSNSEIEASLGMQKAEKNEDLFRHGASPFRTSQDPPPKLGWQHAWGMMTWGKKAGAWGKGPEGLADRRQRKVDQERNRDRDD